jgi:hypothetical protein
MKDHKSVDELVAAIQAAQSQAWYRIGRIKRVKGKAGGSFCEIDGKSVTELGTNLLPDFVAEDRAEPFGRGVWIIGRFIPDTRQELPDWGSLTVRGPGSWILRSRDGRQAWASGRDGTVIFLRKGDES